MYSIKYLTRQQEICRRQAYLREVLVGGAARFRELQLKPKGVSIWAYIQLAKHEIAIQHENISRLENLITGKE